MLLPLRDDKHGNPYFRCPMCGLMIFMRTEAAVAALELFNRIIAKNPGRWRQVVIRTVTKRTKSIHRNVYGPKRTRT